MALMPGVVHDLVATTRNMRQVDGIVIHTIVGFQSGGKAAHWTTDAGGTVRQHRDTGRQSAANLDGNGTWLAIENEDHGPAFGNWNTDDGHAVPSFTAAQCEAIATILVFVHRQHGVPLDIVPDTKPGRRGVAYHRQGINGNFNGFDFGGRVSGGVVMSASFGKVCPGDRRIHQLLDTIIPRARVLAGLPQNGGDDMSQQDVDNLLAWVVKGGPDSRNPTPAVVDSSSLFGRMLTVESNLADLRGFISRGGPDTADGPRPGISDDSVIGRLKAQERATDEMRATMASMVETLAAIKARVDQLDLPPSP